jgi:transposase
VVSTFRSDACLPVNFAIGPVFSSGACAATSDISGVDQASRATWLASVFRALSPHVFAARSFQKRKRNPSGVVKWSQRFRATGSPAAKRMDGNQLRSLAAERDWLLARLAAAPDLTLRALVVELGERGVVTSYGSVWRIIHDAGISFKKNSVRHRAGSTPNAISGALCLSFTCSSARMPDRRWSNSNARSCRPLRWCTDRLAALRRDKR